ncbi:sugar transferase [Corynebacterium sp. 335C]
MTIAATHSSGGGSGADEPARGFAKPIARAGSASSDRDWNPLGSYGRDPSNWERFRMRHRVPSILYLADLVMLALAFAVIPVVDGGWLEPYGRIAANLRLGDFPHGLIFAIFAATLFVSWVWMLRNRRLYDGEVFRDHVAIAQRIVEATMVAFGVPAFVAAAVGWDSMRDFILIALPLGLLWMFISHFLLQAALRRLHFGDSGARYLVVLTEDQYADRRLPQWRRIVDRMTIVGYVIVDGDRTGLVDGDGDPVLGVGCDGLCADALENLGVDEIVVMCPSAVPPEWLRRMTWACAPLDVAIYLYPNLASVSPQRVRASRIHGVSMMKVSRSGNVGANGISKRFVDLAVGSLLILAFSPVLIATAIAVKASDGGPVFYRATRIGRDGEEFRMWKFRSMRTDADALKQKLIDANGGSALLFKMKDDPRVTPVGRFIRRYSIDELPQLFNVVGGTMSLIGPRPQVAAERDEYDRDAWMRLTVRPGMTGLWQVSGRSNLSGEEAISLDLLYIDNWTPSLDASILLRTAKAVLGKDGAY